MADKPTVTRVYIQLDPIQGIGKVAEAQEAPSENRQRQSFSLKGYYKESAKQNASLNAIKGACEVAESLEAMTQGNVVYGIQCAVAAGLYFKAADAYTKVAKLIEGSTHDRNNQDPRTEDHAPNSAREMDCAGRPEGDGQNDGA